MDGFLAGGANVQLSQAEQDVYGVELFAAPGRTIRLADARGNDLEPSREQLG